MTTEYLQEPIFDQRDSRQLRERRADLPDGGYARRGAEGGEDAAYRPTNQYRYRDEEVDFYPEHKQHSPTYHKEYVIFKYIGTKTPPEVRKTNLLWRSINTQKYTEEQIKRGEAPEVPRASKIINGKHVHSEGHYYSSNQR